MNKKLALSKNTVANLSQCDMKELLGGGINTLQDWCITTVNVHCITEWLSECIICSDLC